MNFLSIVFMLVILLKFLCVKYFKKKIVPNYLYILNVLVTVFMYIIYVYVILCIRNVCKAPNGNF